MLLKKETYGDKPLSLTCKINFVNMRDNEVYMWLDYVNIVFCLFGVFRPNREFFTEFGDVTMTAVKSCKI